LFVVGALDDTAEDRVGLHIIELLVELFSFLQCHPALNHMLVNDSQLLVLRNFHLADLFSQLLAIILEAGLRSAERGLSELDTRVGFQKFHLLGNVGAGTW